MVEHDVKNVGLAGEGRLKIEWAEQSMPVLRQVRERFTKEQPLKGIRLGACLHVTTETAVLMLTLKAGGAQLALCASNPLSTQDDTAAALVREYDVPVFAQKGDDHDTYYRHLASVLETRPQVTMDDGADLISQLHREGDRGRDLVADVIGGTEETTTGVIRIRAMEKEGVLAFPVVAVNDGRIKRLGHNKKLGNFIVLEDDYGNRFTYAQLGKVAKSYPVPKRHAAPVGGRAHGERGKQGKGAEGERHGATEPAARRGGRAEPRACCAVDAGRAASRRSPFDHEGSCGGPWGPRGLSRGTTTAGRRDLGRPLARVGLAEHAEIV